MTTPRMILALFGIFAILYSLPAGLAREPNDITAVVAQTTIPEPNAVSEPNLVQASEVSDQSEPTSDDQPANEADIAVAPEPNDGLSVAVQEVTPEPGDDIGVVGQEATPKAGLALEPNDGTPTSDQQVVARGVLDGEPNSLVLAEGGVISDPNSDPNEVVFEPAIALHPEPNEPELPAWERPDKYWQRRYHPQVNERIFLVLSYPYYPGGQKYVLERPLEERPQPVEQTEQTPQVVAEPPPPNKNNQDAKSPESVASESPVNEEVSDPNEDPASKSLPVTKPDGPQLARLMEKCCHLIHQWRNLNESEGTTLEVVRAIELARTSTDIYRMRPQLAIRVRRTLGQIGHVNRMFDQTSRMTMVELLTAEHNPILMVQMEKQLADLTTLLDRLAEENDAISMALGVGQIDRANPFAVYDEKINYSDLASPISKALLSAEP